MAKIRMFSAETETTIIYDTFYGTALSVEDGVRYNAKEMRGLKKRLKVTGKGITKAEHLKKASANTGNKEFVDLVCKVFDGEVLQDNANRDRDTERRNRPPKGLGVDCISNERREKRRNPATPTRDPGPACPAQRTFGMD